MIKSTIPPFPLTINMIFRHGRNMYGSSEVVTFDGEKTRRKTFAEVADRVDQLGAALRRLGVKEGDRVATFSWNHQEHLEAYLAVPALGAVLHTLNVRLFLDQLKYIINHAEDKVIIVDDSLVPVFAQLVGSLDTVEKLIVVGSGDASALGEHLRYEELLAEEATGFDWPELDENAAAAMCYTSGTTGNPKGVVYSHRST
ncbi:MAG: AMP-binding protein, partial [Acidimicrobiia bacterium]